MSSKKEIVIKDACILFDLVDLNLLGDFFQLEVIAFTTPQVVGEITNESQWSIISEYIRNEKLKVDSDGQFEILSRLYEEHPGLSFADSSVLELAIRKQAVLLSSDGSLRKISVKMNLVVRGVLWIIEELYNKEFIGRDIAIEKLKLYESVNQRAPVKEIQNLINKFSK